MLGLVPEVYSISVTYTSYQARSQEDLAPPPLKRFEPQREHGLKRLRGGQDPPGYAPVSHISYNKLIGIVN